VLICAGREAAQASLRQGLAMGADRAILIQHDNVEGADGLTRARVLAEAVKEESPDMVLVGKYGVGPDEFQTGPMMAELLEWPHAGAISKIELEGGAFTVERDVEGAVEVQKGELPAIFTCEKGLNEPRYPSLKGIMQAKKKPIDTRTPSDPGSPALVWDSMELPPARAEGRIIEGTPQEAAEELVRLLNEEKKVI
jgi:electron transfer flavoprotein beta subunit